MIYVSCYPDSIWFYFVAHAILIAFIFILSDEVQLGVLALQRLDPFDFRAFGSSAQGDCSWEVRALFRAFVLILFHAIRRAFFIFLTIVRSLDFARDDPREGRAIRIAFSFN